MCLQLCWFTLHSTAMMVLHINSSPWMGLDVQASDRYARSVREAPGCVRASGYWSGVAICTLQGGQRSACQRGSATCQVQVSREAKDYCQQEVVRGRLRWNVVSAMSCNSENIETSENMSGYQSWDHVMMTIAWKSRNKEAAWFG